MYNFHVFVSISTIIYYIILRSFQVTSQVNTNKPRRKKRESKLAYVMFLPLVLYVCYYFFVKRPAVETLRLQGGNLTSSIDTSPFPASKSLSVSM